MAKQRSSFAKLQRDKQKKERAVERAARRQERKADQSEETETEEGSSDVLQRVMGEGEPSPNELLQLVEDLHNKRDAGTISEEDFEEAKIELFARLQVD